MNIPSYTDNDKLDGFLKLQEFILNKQKTNEPFFIGRLSGNETSLTGKLLSNQQQIPDYLLQNMLFVAGIKFISIDDIIKYVTEYHNSIINSQLLGIWDSAMYTQAIEYYNILNNIQDNIVQIPAQALEPFYFMNHSSYKWNNIFKNKKVLIISSHKNTIEKQLPYIDKIFSNNIFDKTTEFHVYKPPQQNGGSHDNNSWQYHFNIIKNDLKELVKTFDFDIALVSCGGFGMLTSNYIFTELHKSTMYIGGSLQLFFGIKGGRWQSNDIINKSINSYWVNVIESDKPKNVQICEGSAYW